MLTKGTSAGNEKIFINVKNSEGSSLTTGYLVAMRIGTAASLDGNSAVLADSSNAADCPAFLGVAAQDVAPNTVGLVQSGGWAASVYLSNTGTSVTINTGDPLVPGAGAGGATSAAPTYANSGFKFILASNCPAAISAAGYVSGWIRF